MKPVAFPLHNFGYYDLNNASYSCLESCCVLPQQGCLRGLCSHDPLLHVYREQVSAICSLGFMVMLEVHPDLLRSTSCTSMLADYFLDGFHESTAACSCMFRSSELPGDKLDNAANA